MPTLPRNNIVSVYHQVRTGNTEAWDSTAAYTGVVCCLAPTGTDVQPSVDVPAFQLFELFVYDTTVVLKAGDKVIDQNGTVYLLDGVPYVMSWRPLSYIRAMLHEVV